MSVEVYDLAGQLVWADDLANVTKIVWNGKDDSGAYVANGAYIYVVEATDGTDTFGDTGTLFINR
jgi:flagellar hook assembly protein FlgD